jgi:glycerate 2-kinase
MAALLRGAGAARAAVTLLPPSQASVDTLAAEYVALAERARKPQIFVRAAEPSVTVTASGGRGGRSTHLAASVGQLLGERRLDDANRLVFAALASDGIDGRSGTGGAIIDGLFAERVAARLGDGALVRSLERFDTGTLHGELGTAVRGGSTGHNLADLHVLVVPGRDRLAHAGS